MPESLRDTFAAGFEVGFLAGPGPKEGRRRFTVGKSLESLKILFGENSFCQLGKIQTGLHPFQINPNPGAGRHGDGGQIVRM